MRNLILLGLLITSCAAKDIRSYDGTYDGILKSDCYQEQYVHANVANGYFHLPLPFRRDITGRVTLDGNITGVGTWRDQSGEAVYATVDGHIAGKMLGRTMVVHVHDGHCDLDITMAPPQPESKG